MKRHLFIVLILYTALACAQDTVTVVHQRYTTTFDKTLHYPVKVHWIVSASDVCKKNTPGYIKRTNDFRPDPALPDVTDLAQDYHSASDRYDRGHNMDAADNSCNPAQMHECFYFSNMTAQTKHLNEQTWRYLEDHTRQLAENYGKVEVWCGSYGKTEMIGKVTVPAFCWKILRYNGKVEAYIFPNSASVNINPYTEYRSSVSSVRNASHLFLADVPDF